MLVFYSLVVLFNSCDSDCTLVVATLLMVVSAACNAWLLIELSTDSLSASSLAEMDWWEFMSRNVISWNLGVALVFFVQFLGQWAKYLYGVTHEC